MNELNGKLLKSDNEHEQVVVDVHQILSVNIHTTSTKLPPPTSQLEDTWRLGAHAAASVYVISDFWLAFCLGLWTNLVTIILL